LVLLIASLFFYGWGEPRYLTMIGIAIVSAWVLGLVIGRGGTVGTAAFWLSVTVSLGLLGWFKYADFFIESFAQVTGMEVETLGIALPIGISFYTFQILSYTIDVYRGRIAPQKNMVNFAMYVSLFPQLIAGPIVVYSQVEKQLDPAARVVTAEALYQGASRFVIGLSKKVLLANQLGMLVNLFGSIGVGERSVVFYWMYAVAFSLQIYFDFSGYSDMAIGLGRMLGFNFPENFNYPYISRSVTEFWRRWHMTLGQWFREYVYIPLGGNRVSTSRWVLNLFAVWGLTGLWHGAAWNFVIWGLYHGTLLLLEKFALGKILARAPGVLSHVYVLLVVVISMVIFNAANMTEAIQYIGGMFGIVVGGSASAGTGLAAVPFMSQLTGYYLRSYGLLFVFAMIGATPAVRNVVNCLRAKTGVPDEGKNETKSGRSAGAVIMDFAEPLVLAGLLLLVTAYLVDGSFNPFLYFRF
ncbi:MAG: MBOAT family protein, partial [Firmicutes bacterium]|nr:MBOAT family protein [Bacillota bacterium]